MPWNAIAVPRESKTCAECPDGDFGPYSSALCWRTVREEALRKEDPLGSGSDRR
jgi:hypothetical protein